MEAVSIVSPSGDRAVNLPVKVFVEAIDSADIPILLTTSETQPAPRYNWLVPVIGLVLLALISGLYVTNATVYDRVLTAWMFIPAKDPFYDLASIPGWQRCWQNYGYAVYTNASWADCGLGPIIYSPLWLRLTFLPTDPAWTNWLGLPVVVAFLLCLGLLPLSFRPTDRIFVILATFSCPPVFAMERANVDLLIFLMAVGVAFCLKGSLARRALGYALMLIGGLLKFYPLALLVLVIRERLVVAVMAGLTAAAIVAGTAFGFLDELRRLTPVPSGAPFHFMWGARNIPTGLPTVIRAFLRAIGAHASILELIIGSAWMPSILAPILFAAAFLTAARLAGRDDFRASLNMLADGTYRFLLVGSVLIVACFFAGQNINYRSIFLLLILPGSLSLTQVATSRLVRDVMILTTASILCVLWELTVRNTIAGLFGGSYLLMEDSIPIYAVWIVKEVAWWWLVTILIAILIRFAMDSPAWRDFQRGRSFFA